MARRQQLTPEQQQWLDDNLNLAERISASLTSSDEFIALLIGVLNRIEANTSGGSAGGADVSHLATAIDALVAAITGGSVNLKNPPRIATGQLTCPAINAAVQMPKYKVPYKKAVVIKALSGNLGMIGVGNSPQEAQSALTHYPLLANEAVEYEVEWTDTIYIVAATNAGEGIAWTVEQE